MISKTVGVETKRDAWGIEAKKATTLRRMRAIQLLIWINRIAKGEKKKEKSEAMRLRGTIIKPTQGMKKRLVKNPMRENRLKWRATKGAVPKIATPVTRKESKIYFRIFFFQEMFGRKKISSHFSLFKIRGTR